MTSKSFVVFGLTALVLESIATGGTAGRLNAQLDLNDNGVLDDDEVKIGLVHKRSRQNLPALRKLKPKERQEAVAAILKAVEFQEEKSDLAAELAQLQKEYALENERPPYALDRIDPRAFGLRHMLSEGETAENIALRPQATRWGAAMRRTREQVLKALREPVTDIQDPFAEGALISYRRDQKTNVDSIQVAGTAGLSWHLGPNPHFDHSFVPKGQDRPVGATLDNTAPLRNSELFFLATIDRLDTDQPIIDADRNKPNSNPDERDTLEFEFGLTNLYAWPQRIPAGATDPRQISRWGDNWLGLSALGVTGALKWTTDSEIRRNVWGGSLSFNPVWAVPGMEAWHYPIHYRNRFGRRDALFGYRFSLTGDVLGGAVEEEGSTDFNRLHDTYLYAGFTAALEVRPVPDLLDQRMTWRAEYSHYEALLSETESTQEFRASMRYYIPFSFGFPRQVKAGGVKDAPYVYEPGQLLWALQIEYRKGQRPITLEEDHSLTFGAGVAF